MQVCVLCKKLSWVLQGKQERESDRYRPHHDDASAQQKLDQDWTLFLESTDRRA